METAKPPRFLSMEFHTRFFPDLVRNRLRPKERTATGFVSGFDSLIVFFIAIAVAAIGISYAVSHRSVIGWIAGGAGVAGVLALFVQSVVSRENIPCYESFLFGVFGFFVTLGATAGIFIGTLEHSLPLVLTAAPAGLAAGYLLGILAGLWFQYLGWIAVLVNGIAALAVVGMIVVDLVLLSGALFG
ncbi:MAG: hypothetical protein HY896_08155 [Deltaproteobacteria bacterium]|nr:hypothetical protein [Deltaproteobacteria bacterium]